MTFLSQALPLYFRIFEVMVQLHMRGTCNVFAIIFGITNLKVYIGQRVQYDLREEKLRLCHFHSVMTLFSSRNIIFATQYFECNFTINVKIHQFKSVITSILVK